MSVIPKVYASLPHGLRGIVLRWVEQVDDHLVGDEPNDD